jgi:hypothetical protein
MTPKIRWCVLCDCAIGKTVEDGVWLMRDGVKAKNVVWQLSAVNLWGRRLHRR